MTLIDVRDVASVIAACMHTGRGLQALHNVRSRHLTADELLSLLCEVTGRNLKSVPVPKAVFSLWGRVGDLARRFGRDLVLTTEGVEYMFNYCARGQFLSRSRTPASACDLLPNRWPMPSHGCGTTGTSRPRRPGQ